MNRKQEKKLIRLISAVSDVDECLTASEALIAGAPDPLFNHLFVSMVVSYGRPFTENYGAGRIQNEYPNFPDELDSAEDLRQRHNRLIDMRDKFLAHSSVEGTQVIIIPPGVPNPLGIPAKPVFDFNVGKRRFGRVEFVEWLRILPLTFQHKLMADIQELLVALFGKRNLTEVFELKTGYEAFRWTEGDRENLVRRKDSNWIFRMWHRFRNRR